MTTDQNKQNYITARRLIGQEMFGPSFDGSAAAYAGLSAADQVRLTDELAYYIVNEANPSSFSIEQIHSASAITNKADFRRPLADTSFSYDEFKEEFSKQAGSVAANYISKVGQGLAVAVAVAFLVSALKSRPRNDDA